MGFSGVSAGATLFVGRVGLLDRLTRPADGGVLHAENVVGGSGMGKSSLLRHLARRVTAQGNAAVCLLDLEVFQATLATRQSGVVERVAPNKDLKTLERLARAAIEQASPEALSRLDAVVHRVWTPFQSLEITNTLVARKQSEVSDVHQVAQVKLSAGALELAQVEMAQAAAEALTDEVAAILSEVVASRALLLLVDNVDVVADSQLAAWLADTLTKLRGGVVVLTQQPGRGLDLPDGVSEQVRIPPLTVAEVALYLEARQVGLEGDADLAQLVHQCSGGIPVGVCLLTDLLADPRVALRAEDLRDRLVGVQVDPEGRIARVVAEMVERLERQHVGLALRVASLTPECDVSLLTKLLEAAGATDVNVPEVMAEVEAFSFTEEYEGPDHTWYVSVHPFVARGLAQSFRRHHDEGLVRRLHAIAAEHHFATIVRGTNYGEKFLYEDPVAQATLRKWLYHLGRADPGRRAFCCITSIFLDAFWWWGSYVHLDFCDSLLADVRRVAAESDDRGLATLVGALGRFNDLYPYRANLRRSYDHRYPSGVDWEGVRDALLQVGDLCGLDVESRDPSAEERKLRALYEIFMAHTYRYAAEERVRDPYEAMSCYERAEAHLSSLGEEWDRAWVIFERADVLLEAGDAGASMIEAATAARVLAAATEGGEPDEELIANLHRLRADCAWAHHEQATAMFESGRAVLHAYLFHRIGGPPDDYTMQYYYEQQGRALDRLMVIARDDIGAALDAAEVLVSAVPEGVPWPRPDRESLVPLLYVRSLPVLADALFKRGPTVDELGVDDSPFLTELRRVHHALRGRVRDDLTVSDASRSADGPSRS